MPQRRRRARDADGLGRRRRDDRPLGRRRALAGRRDRAGAGDAASRCERRRARCGSRRRSRHLESLLTRMGAHRPAPCAQTPRGLCARRRALERPAPRAGHDRRPLRCSHAARTMLRGRTIPGGGMNRRERPNGPTAARGPTRCGCSTPCRSRCWRSTPHGAIVEVNTAAEHFFEIGRARAVALAPRRSAAVRLAGVRTRRRRARDPIDRQRLQARHLDAAHRRSAAWSTPSSRRCR